VENAEFQLDRVAGKWAAALKRDSAQVKGEIETMVHEHTTSPGGGLFGEPIVNVLGVNLALRTRARRNEVPCLALIAVRDQG
jgi:K+-transporting ATPase ATPase C chain